MPHLHKALPVRHNTMRHTLILILIFVFFNSYGQTGEIKYFKRTDSFREILDTIKLSNGKIDVSFFSEHFNTPYHLPNLVDGKFKDQTDTIWGRPNAKKNYKENWNHTYTYDSYNRLTSYAYSGCRICSGLPYNYVVTYNAKGQVVNITNTINKRLSYDFYYNNKGDIIKCEEYFIDILMSTIILLE